MSDTGIQNPLGVNVVASAILNEGLSINPVAQRLIGTSQTNDYYTPGSIVNDTCLSWVTQSIQASYYINIFKNDKLLWDTEVIADVVGLTNRYGLLTIKKVIRGGILPRAPIIATDTPIVLPSNEMVGLCRYRITELGETNWALQDVYGQPPFYDDFQKYAQYVIVSNPPGPHAGYQTDFTAAGAVSNDEGTVFTYTYSTTIPTLPGYTQGQVQKLGYTVGTEILSRGGGLTYALEGKGVLLSAPFYIGNLVSGDGNSPGSQWQIFANYVVAPGDPWCLTNTPFVSTYMNLTDINVKFYSPNLTYYNANIYKDTYDNLLAMGQSRIPALSNSLPPTYLINDPSNVWEGQATSGYAIEGNVGQGQEATWFPYDTDNDNYSVTQWGFLRCLALQAWNVFNWQGSSPLNDEPEYKNFATQFLNLDGFIDQSNKAIFTLRNSVNFLDGTFSNTNDLITGDITGVNLSTQAFGEDLTNLGKAISLSSISKFGLPSVLLQTLQENNALTQPVILALLTSGLSQNQINEIGAGNITPNTEQEQQIYGAFSVIAGEDCKTILKTLGCKTKGLFQLIDLLNIQKMFPISYTSLTVPVYNTSPGPTNSKTYYLLFVDREVNPQLFTQRMKKMVGPIQPIVEPPPPLPDPIPTPVVEEILEIIAEQPIVLPPPPTPDIPIPPAVQPPPPPQPVPPPKPVVNPPPIPSPQAPAAPKPVPLPAPVKQGGAGCVALESFVPLLEKDQKHNGREITKAWMLESGMKISLGTEQLDIVDGSVLKTLNDYQPCVRISTVDGISLVCSTTAPILTKDKGFIPATEVYGKRVAVMRNGVTWYDEVVGLEDVGMKFVRVIDAGNNSFWAGERPGSFILHHNVPIKDSFDYDKK